jgi:class 3 adenylate cyclase
LELDQLLDSAYQRTADLFERMPKVEYKTSLDLENLPVNAKTWHRLDDLVAVFFDLKSSTNLEKGRRPASTASIYDAGVGGVVKILEAFDADFVDIQGDGGFGLFWGELRYERAMCAGISIRTFSTDFTQKLEHKWPEAPSTGFKVGIASGSILVKKVGLPRHLDLQEPVWAGRPVNYAAKAAQQTDPEHILVTGSVWDEIEDNDFLAFSCGCSDGKPDAVAPSLLWEERTLDKIPDDERFGQALKSGWCTIHGEEFCTAILAGETKRAGLLEKALHSRNLLASGSVEKNEASKRRRRAREEFKTEFTQERFRQLRSLLDELSR